MYSYCVFGLEIQSDLRMGGLPAGHHGCDIQITLQPASLDGQLVEETGWLSVDRESAVLNIKNICRFTLNAGREVILDPAEGVRQSLLRQYLIGPVLAILLYQRGLLVLHASSVVIAGSPVAIMADSGWGKSSLAGMLQHRGHPVLSDDLTPVEFPAGQPQITAGPAQLKLNADVAQAIGLDWDRLTRIDSQESKRWLKVKPIATGRQLPLKKIFLLTGDKYSQMIPVPPQQKVIELIRHTYPTRLGFPGDAKHLQLCGMLARSTRIVQLARSADLSDLPDIAHCLENLITVEQGIDYALIE